MKNKKIILVILVFIFIITGFIIAIKVKNYLNDKHTERNFPAKNTEELLLNHNEVESIDIYNNKIVLMDSLNLKVGDFLVLWLYSDPKFLGLFEIKENNGIKYIDGLDEKIQKENIANGQHHLAISNNNDELLGYVSVNVLDGNIEKDKKVEKKYKIIFNTTGGEKIDSIEVSDLNEVDIENIIPKREGYEFLYWEYNNQKFIINDLVDNNITLIAKWEKNDVLTTTTKRKETTTTTTTKATTTTTTTTKPIETTTKKTIIYEKELGSYPIPKRTPVCHEWQEEFDGEIISGKSYVESEVDKYVDMWTDYYGFFYTPGTDKLYIAEGLLLEFMEYGRVYVTDELCNKDYAGPLYQVSPNLYIRNYVKTYNVNGSNINPKLPYSNYKVKCTKEKCWEY